MKLTFFMCLLLALTGCGPPVTDETEETPTNADIVNAGGGDIVTTSMGHYRRIVEDIKHICQPKYREQEGEMECGFRLLTDYCRINSTDNKLCAVADAYVRIPYLIVDGSVPGEPSCTLCSTPFGNNATFTHANIAGKFLCGSDHEKRVALPMILCKLDCLKFKDF